MDRPVWMRMFSEGLLIVASILLALSADAWLGTRNQAAQLDSHVVALGRDFDTMLERVNSSYSAASRGVKAGIELFLHPISLAN